MKSESKFNTKIAVLVGTTLLIVVALITFNVMSTKKQVKGVIESNPVEANSVLNDDEKIVSDLEQENGNVENNIVFNDEATVLNTNSNIEETTSNSSSNIEETTSNSSSNIALVNWTWPTTSKVIVSHYGNREPLYEGFPSWWHSGIDITGEQGASVYAANNGVVVEKTQNMSYGNYILIKHGDNLYTLYAHMSDFANVSVGDTVTAGQVIGYVGMTGAAAGPHLHFEIRTCEEYSCTVNPVDYYE